jgi:hypothetical protein
MIQFGNGGHLPASTPSGDGHAAATNGELPSRQKGGCQEAAMRRFKYIPARGNERRSAAGRWILMKRRRSCTNQNQPLCQVFSVSAPATEERCSGDAARLPWHGAPCVEKPVAEDGANLLRVAPWRNISVAAEWRSTCALRNGATTPAWAMARSTIADTEETLSAFTGLASILFT